MSHKRILQMSTLLANQIAAGEVVERPASVVKELVENAMDANATQINIDIKQGGKQLIQISDNGSGIYQDDLVLAVAAHATSKIADIDDLMTIVSMGFRGEALASIAAISKLSLTSKPKDQERAFCVTMNAQQEATVRPASHPDGTTVIIEDLFYNTPVRRKFLRADTTEFSHIEEVIKRIALSRFDVGLTLTHHTKIILQCPPATTPIAREARLKKILGSQFLEKSLYLSQEVEGFSLNGWISTPDFSRSQNDLQYFYVNHRTIRDRLLNHAVRQAYADLLPVGRLPAYALYFECSPSEVDVNVHPTKHEVRFRQTRWVHDFIMTAVSNALKNTEDLLPEASSSWQIAPPIAHERVTPEMHHAMRSFLSPLAASRTIAHKEEKTPEKTKFIGWLKDRYCLFEEEENILIIDGVEVKRAECYQQSFQDLQQKQLKMTPLLLPKSWTLSPQEMQWVLSQESLWTELSIDINALADHKIVIRALPSVFRTLDFSAALVELMPLSAEHPADYLRQLAKHIVVDPRSDLPGRLRMAALQMKEDPSLSDHFLCLRTVASSTVVPS